jgi:cell division protein FtsN
VAGYWVQLGPARDIDQLAPLAAHLVERHGIVGRVQTRWTVQGYRVRSAPLRLRRAAEERRRLLEAVGLPSRVVEHPDGYVLDFGRFEDGASAEQTARAVRSRGYSAAVVALRAPAYTLVVGPVSEAAALSIARTLRSGGVEFSLTRR